MQVEKLSRRGVVAGGAAVGLVAAPFVRSANAAGTLTIGLWDHWVPGANDVQTAIIKEWADKEKVDVKIDYITSQGNKLLLTLAAEAQAKSGHDIMEFTNWESAQINTALEPVDDVVKQRRRHQRPDRSGGRVSRQVRGPLARRADDARHAAARLLLALRHDEGACRHRRAGALSRPASRPPTRAGPGTPSWRRPRSARRPASASACRSAPPPTPTSGSARCSWPMARS